MLSRSVAVCESCVSSLLFDVCLPEAGEGAWTHHDGGEHEERNREQCEGQRAIEEDRKTAGRYFERRPQRLLQ